MAVNWQAEVIDQIDFAWDRFMERLAGLTDAEYHWEPAPESWGVRTDSGGKLVADWARPEPVPPPMTTIAWRMIHIGDGVLGRRAVNQFGASDDPTQLPDGADAAIAWLQGWYETWVGGLRALTPDEWDRPTGPTEGPYADAPFLTLVLHIHREVIHHAAEIALLRDLYLRRDGRSS